LFTELGSLNRNRGLAALLLQRRPRNQIDWDYNAYWDIRRGLRRGAGGRHDRQRE
jgi:hypothetical protein